MTFAILPRPGVKIFINQGNTISIEQITDTPVGEDRVVIDPAHVDHIIEELRKLRDEIRSLGMDHPVVRLPEDGDES